MSAQQKRRPVPGQGVRKLTLQDLLPQECAVVINRPLYSLEVLAADRKVLDIGCGHGLTKPVVEKAGGWWVGVEPFGGGANTVMGRGEALPFAADSFDLVVMNAVLEHVTDVDETFAEISRVLKPGGLFVGYSAFMECFHEISYHHLSFRALEHLSDKYGLKLAQLAGGHRFGIDYHLAVLLYPLPMQPLRASMAAAIRGIFRMKSLLASVVLKFARRMPLSQALAMGRDYYALECLRQSVGFSFVIEKPA